jgi:hypothetical protein
MNTNRLGQALGPAPGNSDAASDRGLPSSVLCLLGHRENPQFLPTRVPLQHLYFRVDRGRTYRLPLTLPQGASLSPLPIRDLYDNNWPQVTVIFELFLSLPHHYFPLLLKTPPSAQVPARPLRATQQQSLPDTGETSKADEDEKDSNVVGLFKPTYMYDAMKEKRQLKLLLVRSRAHVAASCY